MRRNVQCTIGCGKIGNSVHVCTKVDRWPCTAGETERARQQSRYIVAATGHGNIRKTTEGWGEGMHKRVGFSTSKRSVKVGKDITVRVEICGTLCEMRDAFEDGFIVKLIHSEFDESCESVFHGDAMVGSSCTKPRQLATCDMRMCSAIQACKLGFGMIFGEGRFCRMMSVFT